MKVITVEQEVKMQVTHAYCPVCQTELLSVALPVGDGYSHLCKKCDTTYQLRHQYPVCEVLEVTQGSQEVKDA